MDLTNLLNIQALDFDIWGFHVKANLIMSVIILIVIAGCWFWNRRKILKFSQLAEQLNQQREQHNYELEKIKLEQAVIEANRKKPTWCHACDVNMVFSGYAKLPSDVLNKSDSGLRKAICECPKCKQINYINNNKTN